MSDGAPLHMIRDFGRRLGLQNDARIKAVSILIVARGQPPIERIVPGAEAVPYSYNSELPPSVRNHLPEHAQDIYREAFNHAFDAHTGDPRREEAAHRIAWAAVKRRYVKEGDHWVAQRA
jgi:cation transport regulator